MINWYVFPINFLVERVSKTYTIGSQSIGGTNAIYVADENRYMYFIGDMSYIYFETLEKYRGDKIDNLLKSR